mmetsp:Transcript_5074/g.9317  ORF Transcript_5074/g.9317 Transcript_5074/m.9317 type:complete len:644 (+) Transcript_5074:141-2072(+)
MAFFFTNMLSCNASQQLLPSLARPLPNSSSKRNSPVTPPLPSYLRNDDFEVFLDEIFCSLHRSLALSEVLRNYKRDFREKLSIRTLTQALSLSSEHFKTVIKNSQHLKSLEDGVLAIKNLRPTFYDVTIPPEITESNQLVKGWRLSEVTLTGGLYFLMRISFKWCYVHHCDSGGTAPFAKNNYEAYAPTFGMVDTQGPTRTLTLEEDEYVIGFKGAKEIKRGCIMELELMTNQGRSVKFATEKRPSSHCEKFEFKSTWSQSVPFGIMGFKVGFKQCSTENYAGISNLVAVCNELRENPARAYLPFESELVQGREALYTPPAQQVHASALQRPQTQQERQRPVHRVVNGITGEYEEEDIFTQARSAYIASRLPLPPPRPLSPSTNDERTTTTTPTMETAPAAPNPHDFQDRSSFPPPPVDVPGLKRYSSIPQESPLAVNFIDHSFREQFLVGPISCEEFDDPVILSDGHTYERQFINKWLAKKNTSPMTRQVLKNKDHILNKLVQQLLALDEGKNGKEELVRKLLSCPLSEKVFKDPVVLRADGVTYERSALEEYLLIHDRTPISKKKISSRRGMEFIENRVIRSLIEYAKNQQVAARKYSDDDEGNERPSGKRPRASSYDWGGMWSALSGLKIAVQKRERVSS